MTLPASLPLLLRSSPPLAVISSTDKGGVIAIVSALCVAFALVSLLIRVYVRLQSRPNPVGWDDALVLGAYASATSAAISIFQSACVFLGVRQGLGKTIHEISPSSLLEIQKTGYADDILYILSVWLTKISVALLFLRLSPKRGHMIASHVDVVVAAVTASVSILIIALRCSLARPWISFDSQNASCTGLYTRWQTVAAFDISSELLIFATSIYLFQALRLPFTKKLSIIFAFASRLLLIVPIALRLHYLAPALDGSNYTRDVTYATICKQVEISYAIIAATLPCLRPFMTATATYYGGAAEGHRTKQPTNTSNDRSTSSGHSQQPKKFESIRLSNVMSRIGGSRSDKSDYVKSRSSQMDGGQSQSSLTAIIEPDGGSWARDLQSAQSFESRQVLVRTDVEHTIEYRSSDGKDADHEVIATAI